jgi:tetratricopeptide (TPR) repeat protein
MRGPAPEAPPAETLEAHLHRRPYDALAWFDLAQRAFALGEYPQMRAALDRALWLEPNFVDAWKLQLNLAKADRDAAQVQRAEAELKRIQALVIPDDQLHDAYCLRLLNRKLSPDSGKKP